MGGIQHTGWVRPMQSAKIAIAALGTIRPKTISVGRLKTNIQIALKAITLVTLSVKSGQKALRPLR